MSFQPSTARQEQNRNKILEDLQKKQQMLKQGQVTPISLSLNSDSNSADKDTFISQPNMSQRERQALQSANASSFGYFITQESQFGNSILPVLPSF